VPSSRNVIVPNPDFAGTEGRGTGDGSGLGFTEGSGFGGKGNGLGFTEGKGFGGKGSGLGFTEGSGFGGKGNGLGFTEGSGFGGKGSGLGFGAGGWPGSGDGRISGGSKSGFASSKFAPNTDFFFVTPCWDTQAESATLSATQIDTDKVLRKTCPPS
jgi:hypothetical protein